jgi:hypothetical protein
MKYIIFECDVADITRVFPFIFPEQLTHSIVAAHMQQALWKEYDEGPTIRSAGFCHIHNGEWQTERGSESLGVPKGHPSKGYEDYRILNMPNAMQGILL